MQLNKGGTDVVAIQGKRVASSPSINGLPNTESESFV